MSRSRDTQRKRLYDAERALADWPNCGRALPTVPEMQEYVDRLIGSAWFQRRWSVTRAEIRPGYGHRNATAYRDSSRGGRLQMPAWARNEAPLLHELAHLCTPSGAAPHGVEFAAILLALIRHQLGDDVGAQLVEAYRARRVRYRWAIPVDTQAAAERRRRAARAAAAATALRRQEIAAKRAVRQPSPPTIAEMREAAATIRRAAKLGTFGAAGTKLRAGAFATARALEG